MKILANDIYINLEQSQTFQINNVKTKKHSSTTPFSDRSLYNYILRENKKQVQK